MILDTSDCLYLFFDWYTPVFFVQAETLSLWSDVVPVYPPPRGWQGDYPNLHAWLHYRLGNECQGRRNRVVRRDGRGGPFGNLVKSGPDGAGGCFDTPLIDVDAVEINESGRITRVHERKQPGERVGKAQANVLLRLHAMGIPVVVPDDRRADFRRALA